MYIFLLIPQFDLLTLGAQLFGLLISLYFFYYYSISTSIANFIEIKKLRTKKLLKNSSLVTTVDKDLEYNLWLISYSYTKLSSRNLLGGITQLVECVLCKHKVIGSSPITSNKLNYYAKNLSRLDLNQRPSG